MENKLYKVTVSTEIMVMAKDKIEATSIAMFNVDNEIRESGEVFVDLIKNNLEVPDSWKECYPFCSTDVRQDERTCGQIAAELPKEAIKEPDKQLELKKKEPEPKAAEQAAEQVDRPQEKLPVKTPDLLEKSKQQKLRF